MSIAAISQSFVAAVKRGGSVAAVESSAPVAAVAPAASEPREQGRRHSLVAATQQALGVDASAVAGGEQAVFRFAHALMHDLRTLAGETGSAPRAWGRRDLGDLAQRLGALATASASTPAVPPMPDLPNPVTTATAAAYIMQVPTSRLLEAFASMQQALGQADQPAADVRAALADVVRRLASRIAPTAPATPAPGAVLSLSA